jgi:DNA-binding winged helix-turn-helix (wHTH) protein
VAVETFRFGQFELDPAGEELRREGRRRRLQAQPFKLLLLLVRRAGTLVTYEDIRGELWGEGTFVEFDQAVHYAIRQIREALGDSADKPLYIETVPRRGYRFIAPLEAPAAPSAPAAAPVARLGTAAHLHKALWANIAELREAQARSKRNQVLLVGLVALLVVVLIGVLMLRS